MRIEQIEAVPFRLPLRRDFRWASLRVSLGGFVLLRVHTDDGLVGLGEATPLADWGGDHQRHGGETLRTVASMLTDVIGPTLIGIDPLAYANLPAVMDKVLRGNSYAKAATDMAIHDLAGKALGVPVHRLLGGPVRDRVPVAHMLGIMDWDEALAEAEAAIADGVHSLQIKGGENADRDIALVTELRRRLGPSVLLRLDANQGYRRAKNAIQYLAPLPPGTIDFLEQPAEGLEEMAAATAGLGIPIVADESCWDPWDALEVTRIRAADVISVYLAKAGGLTRARLVAAIAATAGLPCDVNGSIESGVGNAANVQFALATPNCTLPCVIPISAPAGRHPCRVAGHYYDDDIITEPFRFEGGCLLPLDRPGLGVDIDQAKLDRYRID